MGATVRSRGNGRARFQYYSVAARQEFLRSRLALRFPPQAISRNHESASRPGYWGSRLPGFALVRCPAGRRLFRGCGRQPADRKTFQPRSPAKRTRGFNNGFYTMYWFRLHIPLFNPRVRFAGDRVGKFSGQQVVCHNQDNLGQQGMAQVRTREPGSPSNQGAMLIHDFSKLLAGGIAAPAVTAGIPAGRPTL